MQERRRQTIVRFLSGEKRDTRTVRDIRGDKGIVSLDGAFYEVQLRAADTWYVTHEVVFDGKGYSRV